MPKKKIKLPSYVNDEFLRLLEIDKSIAIRYLKREMKNARARASRDLSSRE